MNHSARERANVAVRELLASRDWSAQTPSRQRILAAFLRLATTNGFNAVTMRTLGRELDLKAPSLYSSFPQGKDEIVAESLRWFTHRFARDLLAAVEATISPEDYWASLVRFHLAQHLRRPEADLWDLLVTADSISRFFSDGVREEVASWLKLYESMYAAAAEEMGFQLSSQTTQVLFTILDGARRWAAWDGSEQEMERLLEQTVALSRAILEVESGSRAAA